VVFDFTSSNRALAWWTGTVWRSRDCAGGGGNLCLKIGQIKSNVDLRGNAEGGVIGGCWDSKACYDEVHFMID